ncbi:DUF5719 family protein [Microbacterium sp. gxy059]|uniref:DUF5719 family protein n=1 Tax=Microbacterium sp. gxy059 TaxID=2957199 RepID=UPI003D99327E
MSTASVAKRIAVGATGLILAAAAVGAAVAPWPTIAGDGVAEQQPAGPRHTLTPLPAETVLACDGPMLALGRDASDAAGLSVAAEVDLVSASADADGPDTEGRIDLPDVGSSFLVRQAPDGESPVPVAASVSADIDAEDMSGLVASACAPGQPESWIVGARVATGVTDILIVQNPSDVPATVEVEVFGVDGAATPSAGSMAIPARSQRAVPVASLAGGETDPVLRVTSEGAPVRASLQSSSIATLEPNGADLQSASLPAHEHVMPRVSITAPPEESAAATTVLRLLGTGPDAAQVTVDVVSLKTGESELTADVDIMDRKPATVDLSDLDPGRYTLRMRSDAPFVAAALQTRGSDYGWVVPSEPFDEPALVAVPGSASSYTLTLANTSDEPVEVAVSRQDGDDEPTTVEVAPGASEQMPAESGQTLRIAPDGPIAASIARVSSGSVATLPVVPDPATPEEITVAP